MWPAGKCPGLAHSLLAQARSWAALLFSVALGRSISHSQPHTIQRTVLRSQCVAEYEGASLGWGLACHRHSTGVKLKRTVIKPKAGFIPVLITDSRQILIALWSKGCTAHLVLFSEVKMPQRH